MKSMSRSHLFLIELIVVILFFAFAGAVTVQVFAKAHELAHDTEALNGATLAVQSAAEADKAAQFGEIDASFDATKAPADGASGMANARAPVYFDADWRLTDPDGAVYVLTSEVVLEERPAGVMAVFHYAAASGNKIIYELDTKKYFRGAR
ncbi:MAG TPA: type II secretion system protein [Bacillota bacterium]|nr:type II secretion system protein [Bacillota bacterium]